MNETPTPARNAKSIKNSTTEKFYRRRPRPKPKEPSPPQPFLKQAVVEKVLLEREELTQEQLATLEAEYIYPLSKKSERFRLAICYCRLCEYHINTMNHATRHIYTDEHKAFKQEKILLNLLLSIPKPSAIHCAALNEILLKTVNNNIPLAPHHSKQCSDTMNALTKIFQHHLHKDCCVRMYGSCASGFALNGANLNLELIYPESVFNHATALMRANEIIRSKKTAFFDVKHDFCCKWPCIEFSYVQNGCVVMPTVVLSVRNTQAYEISEFLNVYTKAFPCLPTMGQIWRLWAKMCDLDNFRSGGLPTYAFDLMLLHYLQQTKPPYIPVLHEIITGDKEHTTDSVVYETDIEKIRKSVDIDSASWNFAEIFIGLLRYYTVGNDSQSFIVNVRSKAKVTRDAKGWNRKRLCIEDPFMPKKNLSQLSNDMFSYLMTCLQSSYKYYGIPQTSSGPLFCYENRKLILTASSLNNTNTSKNENSQPEDQNSTKSTSAAAQRSFKIVFNDNVRNIPPKQVLTKTAGKNVEPVLPTNHNRPATVDLSNFVRRNSLQSSSLSTVPQIGIVNSSTEPLVSTETCDVATDRKKSLDNDGQDVEILCQELIDKVTVNEEENEERSNTGRKRTVRNYCKKKLNDLRLSQSDEPCQAAALENLPSIYDRIEMLDIAKWHQSNGNWPNMETIEKYRKRMDCLFSTSLGKKSVISGKFGSQQLAALLTAKDYIVEIVSPVKNETNSVARKKSSSFSQSSSKAPPFPVALATETDVEFSSNTHPTTEEIVSEEAPRLIPHRDVTTARLLLNYSNDDGLTVVDGESNNSDQQVTRLNDYDETVRKAAIENAIKMDGEFSVRPKKSLQNNNVPMGRGFIPSNEPTTWKDGHVALDKIGEFLNEISIDDEDSSEIFLSNDEDTLIKEIDRCAKSNEKVSSDDSDIEFLNEDCDDQHESIDNRQSESDKKTSSSSVSISANNNTEITEQEVDLELSLAASLLELSQFRFNFELSSLIGDNNAKPFVCCELCNQQGHLALFCSNPDKELPDLRPLQPISVWYLTTVTEFIKMVLQNNQISRVRYDYQERFRRDLELRLQTIWPDEAQLFLFGSSCNGFGFLYSDLDVCLTFRNRTTMPSEVEAVKCIRQVAKYLHKDPAFGSVLPVTRAKVPIVRFFHHPSKLEGDVSFYNLLALRNTQMLYMYSQIDVRAQALGYMAKCFAKQCGIGDASRGSLSSYAYVIMVIHFLQRRLPPVLPILQELFVDNLPRSHFVENWETYFYQDLPNLPKVWKDYHRNKESLGELWLGFLRYYTEIFNPRNDVVQIRRHAPLTKFEKLWTDRPLAIEDPFDLNHNLASGLSKKMFIYIIKAFRLAREVFGDLRYEMLVKNTLWNSLTYDHLGEYLFGNLLLMEEPPPKDRVCRLCERVGHFVENCPLKRSNKGRLLNAENSDEEGDEKTTDANQDQPGRPDSDKNPSNRPDSDKNPSSRLNSYKNPSNRLDSSKNQSNRSDSNKNQPRRISGGFKEHQIRPPINTPSVQELRSIMTVPRKSLETDTRTRNVVVRQQQNLHTNVQEQNLRTPLPQQNLHTAASQQQYRQVPPHAASVRIKVRKSTTSL